jgi:GxxExxY protein
MEPQRRKERGEERSEPDAELNALAFQVIGAAIEVHRVLGPGFLEVVYERAMAVELSLRGIPFRRQSPAHVEYKEEPVGEGLIDLLVADRLIVELKAVDALHPVHAAQVISYLKARRLSLGLLINFNVELLRDGVRRIVLTSS